MTAVARKRTTSRVAAKRKAALPPAPTPTLSLVRASSVDVVGLKLNALTDAHARLVLSDLHEESGFDAIAALLRCDKRGAAVAAGLDRPDCMRLWLDDLPTPTKPYRERVESMTKQEQAAMSTHAERWMRIGLSTERADRPLFEAAAHACYRLSGQTRIPAIVWAPCPVVVAYAGPIATHWANKLLKEPIASVSSSVRASVHDSVDASVRASVHDSVHDSVRASVDASVRDSVDASVDASVRDSVRASVDASVHDSVHDSVRASVDASVRASVDASVDASVRASVDASVDDSVDAKSESRGERVDCTNYWRSYFGGQFWVGGWGWGNAYATFMLDVLGLDPHVDQRGLKCQAYAATASAACWWYATSHFVIVSERPSLLEFDQPPELGKRRQLRRAQWEWIDGNGERQSWTVTP